MIQRSISFSCAIRLDTIFRTLICELIQSKVHNSIIKQCFCAKSELYKLLNNLYRIRDKSDLSKTLEGVIIKLNTKCEDLEERYGKLREENSYLSTNSK